MSFQDFLKTKGVETTSPSPIQTTGFQIFLDRKKQELLPEKPIEQLTGFKAFVNRKKIGAPPLPKPEPTTIPLVEGIPKEEIRIGFFEKIKNWITPKSIRAVRNNNPGNLKAGSLLHDSKALQNEDGTPRTDDQGHLIFPNQAVGWLASYLDLDMKMSGNTRNELLANKAGINVNMADLNQAYATDPNWKYGVVKIYNKLKGTTITTKTDVSTLDRDALQLAVLTQEGFVLPKIDANLYNQLKLRGISEPEQFIKRGVEEPFAVEIPEEEVVLGPIETGVKKAVESYKIQAKKNLVFLPDKVEKVASKMLDYVIAPMVGVTNWLFSTAPNLFNKLLLEQAERAEESPDWKDWALLTPALFKLAKKRKFEKTEADEKIIDWTKKNIAMTSAKLAKMGLFPDKDADKIEKFMFQLGAGAPSLALSIGATILTKSPATAIGIFGLIQKGEKYYEAREFGVPTRKAGGISTLAGITEGALEGLGLNFVFKRYGGPITTILGRMIAESLQEWSQEIGGNIWSRIGWNDQQGIFENAGTAALIGLILGAPTSVTITMAERAGLIDKFEALGFSNKEAKAVTTKVVTEARNGLSNFFDKEILPKIELDATTKELSKIALLDFDTKGFLKELKQSSVVAIKKFIKEKEVPFEAKKPSIIIKEEVKRKREEEKVKPIPKELEPLAVEARKFKNWKEFRESLRKTPELFNQIKDEFAIYEPDITPGLPKGVRMTNEPFKDFYNQAVKEVKPIKPVDKLLTKVEKYGIIDLKRLADYAKKHQGITVNLASGKIATDGYSVSILDKADEIRFSIIKDFDESFKKQFNKLKKQYVDNPNAHMGGWIDANEFVVDVTSVKTNLKQSLYDTIIKRQDAAGNLAKYAKGEDGTIFITPNILRSLEPLSRGSLEKSKSIFRDWEEVKKYYIGKNFKNAKGIDIDIVNQIKKMPAKKEVIKKKTALDKAKERFVLEQRKKKIEERKKAEEQKKKRAERKKKLLEKKPKKVKKPLRPLIKKDIRKVSTGLLTESEIQAEFDKRAEEGLRDIEDEKVIKDLELYQKKVRAKEIVDADYGVKILESYKKRLGLVFDINLVDTILTGRSFFGVKEEAWAMTQPGLGKITLADRISKLAAHHEIIHLIWTKENFHRIKAFKGLDRDAILNDITGGKKMTDREVQEKLAIGFERFVRDKQQGKDAYYSVKGRYLRRFFHSLWNGIKKMFGLQENLNNVQDFYDTLYSSKVRPVRAISMEVFGDVEEVFKARPKGDLIKGKMTLKQNRLIEMVKRENVTKYRKTLKTTLDKDSRAGITSIEAHQLITALMGKVKGYVAKKRYQENIDNITSKWGDLKSIPSLQVVKEMRMERKRLKDTAVYKGLNAFATQHLTAFSIVKMIEEKIGDINGAMSQELIWDFEEGFDKYLTTKRNVTDDLKAIIGKHKTRSGIKMTLGWLETTTGFEFKKDRLWWQRFTGAERIEILLAKYDEGKRAAIKRDGIKVKRLEKPLVLTQEQMEEVWKNVRPVEKEVAEWWVKESEKFLEKLKPVMKNLGLPAIDEIKGYSTIIRTFLLKSPIVGKTPQEVMNSLIAAMFGEFDHRSRLPSKRFTIQRLKDITTGRAVSGNAISNILYDVDRKAYFIGTAQEVNKNINIVNDKYFKLNFIDKFGEPKWNELYHWASGLVSPTKRSYSEAFDKIVVKATRNVSLSLVLGRVTTSLLQADSFAHGVGFLGYEAVPHWINTMRDLAVNPKQVRDFTYKTFPQAKDRFIMPILTEIDNMRASSVMGYVKNEIVKGGTFFAKLFDKVVVPLMYTAYHMEMAKSGNSKLAYQKGMEVLKETQPLASLKDLPRILGGGDETAMWKYIMGRLRNYITKRTTYTFTHLFRPDRIYRMTDGSSTAKRIAKTAAKVSWDWTWSFFITSAVAFLIKHKRLPDLDDGEDIIEFLSYPFQGIFLIGHLIGLSIYGINSFSSMPEQIMNRFIWALSAARRGDYAKTIKHSVAAFSMYQGLPWTQGEMTFSYFLERLRNEDPEIWRLIYRQATLDEGKKATKQGLFNVFDMNLDLKIDLDLGIDLKIKL